MLADYIDSPWSSCNEIGGELIELLETRQESLIPIPNRLGVVVLDVVDGDLLKHQ